MDAQKKILVVEDDTALQDVMRMMLENFGYQVSMYADGLPIMDNRFVTPDLFILDKRLPYVDG